MQFAFDSRQCGNHEYADCLDRLGMDFYHFWQNAERHFLEGMGFMGDIKEAKRVFDEIEAIAGY